MVLLFTDTSFNSRKIGAYRIATVLRKEGVDVEVIDFLSKWNIDDLINILNGIDNIEWAGFSTTFRYANSPFEFAKRITDLKNYSEELKLLDYFRQRKIPLVLGGANADVIKDHVINFWILAGYSDKSIIALHNHLFKNENLIFKNFDGNKLVMSDRDYKDIDLNQIETIYEDSDFIFENEPLPIEISRGCIFKCKFCEFPYIGKKPGTYIRIKDSIKKEIIRNYEKYKILNYIFLDDTFNDCVEKMMMIKEIRQETNIPFEFWAYGRLDLLARFPEMVSLIGEIGWKAFTFGIETLNKKSGSSIGKGANPEKLKNTLLEIKNKYPDIHIQVNLIVGLPHSTKEEIQESVDWLLENNVVDYIKVAPLDIKDPYNRSNSSEFSKNPQKNGYQIISTDTLRYNWKNDYWTITSAKEFSEEMKKKIRKRMNKNMPYNYKIHLDKLRNTNYNSKNYKNVLNELSSSFVNRYIEKKSEHLSMKSRITL